MLSAVYQAGSALVCPTLFPWFCSMMDSIVPFFPFSLPMFGRSFHFWYSFSDCYDLMDPNGNITVTFDVHKRTDDGCMVILERCDTPGMETQL